MYISKIKIENYKGFNNHDVIELKKGINLIIGKNNSGKTSLLEALSLQYNKSHKRIEQVFTLSSNIKLEALVSISEFKNIIRNNSPDFIFKFPSYIFTWENLTWDEHELGYQELYNYIFEEVVIGEAPELIAKNNISKEDAQKEINAFFYSNFSVIVSKQEKIQFILQNIPSINRSFKYNNLLSFQLKNDDIELVPDDKNKEYLTFKELMELTITNNIYKFSIFRFIKAKCQISFEKKLEADCSNLGTVLDNLQGDKKAFSEFVNTFKRVFEGIEDIALTRSEDGYVEIRIWNTEPIKGRPDLAISLDDCGTGVGQVLAILYVVISATEPKVILIDEPNSFLHPSASRKLMEILTEYPQHQYFITTHSPELISNFGDNILHTQLINGEIKVTQIDKKDKEKVEAIFSDLGIRLSDVYGYDSIFWVEGETEEKCLPYLIDKFLPKIKKHNIFIKKVLQTGDFEKKTIEKTVKLFESITFQKNTYVPPSLAYFFDDEGKSAKDKETLKNLANGKMYFTKRRLYENYLLDEDAIFQLLEREANCLNSIEGADNNFQIKKDDITSWIQAEKINSEYWDNKAPSPDELDNWKDKIHAAKLFTNMFKHFFEGKNNYEKCNEKTKISHSFDLTRLICENNPSVFDGFINEIKAIIEKVS